MTVFDSAGNLYIADTVPLSSSAKSMHRHEIITTAARNPAPTADGLTPKMAIKIRRPGNQRQVWPEGLAVDKVLPCTLP